MYSNRVVAVRRTMSARNIDAFLLPRSDQYLNEDLAPADERLLWLCGFSGSQGVLALTESSAALLVDGRYSVQAEQECGDWLDVLDLDDGLLFDWLQKQLPEGSTVGIHACLHSAAQWQLWSGLAAARGLNLVPMDQNPVDTCWADRPALPASPVTEQPLRWAGESSTDKLSKLAVMLREVGCDGLWLPAPDMVAWLLNVRGQDIDIAPLPFSSALLYADGSLDWFIDVARLQLPAGWLPNEVETYPPAVAERLAEHLIRRGCRRIWLEPASCNASTFEQLQRGGASLHLAPHPLLLMRARKNAAELAGMREAHVVDGLALCRFLHQFDEYPQRFLGEDELAVSAALELSRRSNTDYRGVSFETIAACGANGAQPHYLPKPEHAGRMEKGQLLLIDSGGQYPQGTTDVTRVLPIGSATVRQRALYTRVLRAHIALASSRFPKGTSGQQLDSIARSVMWQAGLDYAHGTGHGVGNYLHVHEGPQRIAKHASPVALESGMVVSIEPGVYLPGDLGIRIENLYEVMACERFAGFLVFRALTLAPFEPSLIDREQMGASELRWLDDYHERVCRSLAPHMEPEVVEWLQGRAGAEQSAEPL
ncbi:aminopeptidase P family protein [Pseudomonas juntendi]|uniref:Aminopeptidase P family protein n=1 Tax=Pseudomonas juntendi TaxID=2666183 RepID=A0ABD4YIT7_9PSED|nr:MULTISPECIES: aminopeptidase family protein P [Pseudomonas]MDH0759187.1 aminopeptidase P family protein [Pseudomonas juntendi]MDH1575431.1 aminopeptidase P family protein [Pseudomonas sp. GD03746]MDH1919935.1 aminopeptidase P family protein [Pseudomonas juntendi]